MAHTDQPRKQIPPYLPFSTFQNTLDTWKDVHPSRIDRSVLNKYSGAMQTWIISALRYFALIDNDGAPTSAFEPLVRAEPDERKKLFAAMAHQGYPFLFNNGFDLSKASQNQLRERFAETGAQGETLAKAMSFFTAMAKAADLQLSPFVATRQRRASTSRRTPKKAEPAKPGTVTPQPLPTPAGQTPARSAFEVLYDLLDLQMEKEEQDAVWTLLRYLKKRG